MQGHHVNLEKEEKKLTNDLALLKPGSFIIFKSKKGNSKLNSQHWFQRPWFEQTRGHDTATHVAICVANENGQIEMVHVTRAKGCIREALPEKGQWSPERWFITSYCPEDEVIADKLAKAAIAIAARKNDRPSWSLWVGFKISCTPSRLSASRTPQSRRKVIKTKTICSSLMVQILKQTLQDENCVSNKIKQTQLTNEWDPKLRKYYPNVRTACYPPTFEEWLDRNPTVFKKVICVGEPKCYEEIHNKILLTIDDQLRRLKERNDGKYGRVEVLFTKLKANIASAEWKGHDKSLYLLKHLAPALREKVRPSFFSYDAKSYSAVMECAGNLGISQENISRYKSPINLVDKPILISTPKMI